MKTKIALRVDRLSRLQKQRHINDAKLAKLISINQTQICRVKQRRINPSIRVVAGILTVFPDQKFETLFDVVSGE